MSANVADPYRRYKPVRLGIHVSASDNESSEVVTVRNYELPTPNSRDRVSMTRAVSARSWPATWRKATDADAARMLREAAKHWRAMAPSRYLETLSLGPSSSF
jgi:hypothetical protein